MPRLERRDAFRIARHVLLSDGETDSGVAACGRRGDAGIRFSHWWPPRVPADQRFRRRRRRFRRAAEKKSQPEIAAPTRAIHLLTARFRKLAVFGRRPRQMSPNAQHLFFRPVSLNEIAGQ